MSKLSNQEVPLLKHALHLSGRNAIDIEGVEQVIAFDERQIHLKTSEGRLLIAGKNLQVKALAPDTGKANISGEIDSLSYSGHKQHKSFSMRSIFR